MKKIGPLTAEEWMEFRHTGDDDDFLQCCAETSDFRDAVFQLIRNGGEDKHLRHGFRRSYYRMIDHGLPAGRGEELIERLADYFLGVPHEIRTAEDDLTDAELIAAVKAKFDQKTS